MDLAVTEMIGSVPLGIAGASGEWASLLTLFAIGSALVWLLGVMGLGERDSRMVAGPEWLAVWLLVGLQALLFQV